MKFDGEIMEILAAYDLTGSLRATAELTGCSHHTVARHVAAQFGAVGIVGYVIDVGVFNLFRLDHVGQGTWASSPVGAKVVSVTVATMITWFGNRYWTFRDRRRANFVLELLEFSAIAAIGMGIAVGCLYISHYVLGYTSPLADNVSANVIGLGLATAFRFLMYRYWVYGDQRSDSFVVPSKTGSTPAAPSVSP